MIPPLQPPSVMTDGVYADDLSRYLVMIETADGKVPCGAFRHEAVAQQIYSLVKALQTSEVLTGELLEQLIKGYAVIDTAVEEGFINLKDYRDDKPS